MVLGMTCLLIFLVDVMELEMFLPEEVPPSLCTVWRLVWCRSASGIGRGISLVPSTLPFFHSILEVTMQHAWFSPFSLPGEQLASQQPPCPPWREDRMTLWPPLNSGIYTVTGRIDVYYRRTVLVGYISELGASLFEIALCS